MSASAAAGFAPLMDEQLRPQYTCTVMSVVGIVPEPATTLQTWLWRSVLAGCVRMVTANGELLFTSVVKACVPLVVRTMSLPPLFCRSMDTGVAVAQTLSCTGTVYLVVTQL